MHCYGQIYCISYTQIYTKIKHQLRNKGSLQLPKVEFLFSCSKISVVDYVKFKGPFVLFRIEKISNFLESQAENGAVSYTEIL